MRKIDWKSLTILAIVSIAGMIAFYVIGRGDFGENCVQLVLFFTAPYALMYIFHWDVEFWA